MSTKQQVLELLKNSGNEFLSGQQIAEEIFVTRAAVWKAIKALEKDGYDIDAVTNKGYRLKADIQKMSGEAIKLYLEQERTSANNLDIIYFENIDSTNDYAKEYSNKNFGREVVVIAESQNKGKGRRGRDFYSPKGTGIYMSLLLYPDASPAKATLYTCMMADCVCEAIKEVTDIDTSIKWVNDVYLEDKKIAGILTEGMTSLEDGKLSYMVIGVGVNVYAPVDGFPDEIAKTAGALISNTNSEAFDIRNKLCASIISHFYEKYKAGDMSFVEGYKSKSMLTGKYVKLLTPGHDEKKTSKGYALVTGIDDECHLLVKYDDGTTDTLSCGEVSVVKY